MSRVVVIGGSGHVAPISCRGWFLPGSMWSASIADSARPGIATAHAPMQRPSAKKIAVTPARARIGAFARVIVEERLIRRNLEHSAPGHADHGFPTLASFIMSSHGFLVELVPRGLPFVPSISWP
jgi:hypothetical protein